MYMYKCEFDMYIYTYTHICMRRLDYWGGTTWLTLLVICGLVCFLFLRQIAIDVIVRNKL